MNKSPFLLVSYYTKKTYYEKEAQDLIASCEKFGIDYHIEGIDSLGNWNRNCLYKATFILNQLEKAKRPIVWTDADSILCSYPTLFDQFPCDIAARMPETLHPDDPGKVRSGTLYINYTEQAISLVKEWVKMCSESDETDQICLKKTLLAHGEGVRFYPLPATYCMIHQQNVDDLPSNDVVFLHTQASRLYQKLIDHELVEFPFLQSLSNEELKELRFYNPD
ncbi:MAG: hypothetical protein S4CHLAM102_06910 [Chlamydiia bacterium]|nr:hypothetical protein [Chlamydiia bacterium]